MLTLFWSKSFAPQVSSHLGNIVAHGVSASSPGGRADASEAAAADGADSTKAAGEATAEGDAERAASALATCLAHYASLLSVSEAHGADDLSRALSQWTDTLQSATSAAASGDVPQRRAEGAQLMALACLGLALGRLEGDGAALAQVLPAEAVSRAAAALIEALRGCARPSAGPLASGLLRIVLLPPKGFERGTQADVALGAAPLASHQRTTRPISQSHCLTKRTISPHNLPTHHTPRRRPPAPR